MRSSGTKRESMTAVKLRPEITVTRQRPVNLREPDADLFRHELAKTIPPTQLLRFSNVRITPEGILIKAGRILPESFAFSFLRDEWKMRSVVKLLGRNYLFRKIRDVKEEVVWLTDAWSAGYFHWVADVLSKVFLVRDLARERTVLLPSAYARFDFVRPSLAAFDIRKIQFMGPDEVVRCETLLVPTPVAPSGHFRNDVIHGVRQQLLERFGSTRVETDRRIYVSRTRAPKRKISNEAEVCALLLKHGFETVHAEDLPFVDQVRLFSEARYLVSNHGAGLTNMLFSRRGASVLELRHKADRINNCYFTLAAALGFDYFYQLCEPTSDRDPHTADLSVDMPLLEKTLLSILGH